MLHFDVYAYTFDMCINKVYLLLLTYLLILYSVLKFQVAYFREGGANTEFSCSCCC